MEIKGKEGNRKVTIKVTKSDEMLIKDLNKKYYRKVSIWNTVPSILKAVYVFLYLFQFVIAGYAIFGGKYYFEILFLMIIILFIFEIGLYLAIRRIDNKEIEIVEKQTKHYTYEALEADLRFLRLFEDIPPQKNKFVMKDNILFSKNGCEILSIEGDIPEGDITISIQPYEDVHAWMIL